MKKLSIVGGEPVGRVKFPAWPVINTESVKAVQDVLESGNWGGNVTYQTELSKRFAEYCGTEYCIPAANGTVTLRIALEALGIGPGDEVIVPGLTWQATAAVVLDVNAVPVLVDIDPETYTIDPKRIEAAITPRTKCIIPVHLYGRTADMDAIMGIAAKYNLAVIEDCAHQPGSRWRGKSVGSIGKVGSFSLQASKTLNAGEGGLLITDDRHLHDLLQSLRCCGRPFADGSPVMQSGNYRMPAFQAALTMAQLLQLEEQNKWRETNARYIEQNIGHIHGLKPMYRHKGITVQAYYNFTLRYDPEAWDFVPKSAFIQALKAELGDDNFPCGGTYEPLNNSPLYQPHSKRTHRWTDEYWHQIDPSQFHLPVCRRAYEEEAVNFFHTVLLTDREGCDILIEAMTKLRENSGQLVRFADVKAAAR